MTTVPVVRFTSQAAYFVQLLQDFGHLEGEVENELVLRSTEAAIASELGVISLELVRVAAADLLFQLRQGEYEGVLAEDWPLLFS